MGVEELVIRLKIKENNKLFGRRKSSSLMAFRKKMVEQVVESDKKNK